jgi:hypothetical protein
MKTLAAVAFVSGLALTSASYAADVRVSGVVSGVHAGTALTCFQLVGSAAWYAIPVSNGGGYQVQADAVLLAYADKTPISFFADRAYVDPSTKQPFMCHGVNVASWGHDIDQPKDQ